MIKVVGIFAIFPSFSYNTLTFLLEKKFIYNRVQNILGIY